jgi:hypothetical protein
LLTTPLKVLRSPQPCEACHYLQQVLTNGAPGAWNTGPGPIDGAFGPHTKASVEAFQAWGGVPADGVVGDETWLVSLHTASATLETKVGLQFVVGWRLRAGSLVGLISANDVPSLLVQAATRDHRVAAREPTHARFSR